MLQQRLPKGITEHRVSSRLQFLSNCIGLLEEVSYGINRLHCFYKGVRLQMEVSELERVLGTTLLRGEETVQTEATLGGSEMVLLYFSAHWCHPCRVFTRELLLFYNSVNTSASLVEVIYVSCDQDLSTFQEYYSSMPWLAIDYAEKGRRERLCKDFNATCIPKLVLIGKDGSFRCDSCRGDVETAGAAEVLERWRGVLNFQAE